MDEDPYKTLGVSRTADSDEIQKAYRKLARKYHPDKNPDDKSAKQKFQEVQTAFDLLSDPEKKKMYDQYGAGYGANYGANYGPSGGHGGPQGPSPFDGADFSEMFGGAGEGGGGGFSDIFRQFTGGGPGRRGPQANPRRRGSDLRHELLVPFNTAVTGGQAQINVQRAGGKRERITVKIPAGIDDGKKIRLRGQGETGQSGGAAGDVLIVVRVAPHPFFTRRGKRLDVEVPVTLAEAAGGAKIDVPTPQGTIALSIPPGTSSGTRLRVKGHGVHPAGQPPGDLFAEILIVLPKDIDESDLEAIRDLDAKYPQSPRRDLQW